MTVLFIFKGKVERVLGVILCLGKIGDVAVQCFSTVVSLLGEERIFLFTLSSWNRYLMSLKVLYVTQVICQKIQGWQEGSGTFYLGNLGLFSAPATCQ